MNKSESPKPPDTDQPQCMFCSANQEKIPLIILRFQGGETFVCPKCLPRLVHPER